MFAQSNQISTENGNSIDVVSDLWRGREGDVFAATYRFISDLALGTSSRQSWEWLNDSTLPFIVFDFVAKPWESVAKIEIREKNLKAIALLEKWFSKPDNLGQAFWEKFDKDLEANKFTI